MHISIRSLFLLGAALILLLSQCLPQPVTAQQNPIQLGDIVGTAQVQSRSLRLTGEPAALVGSLSQLVTLHGGLRETSERADFTIHIRETGANSVAITISSAGQQLWQQSFTADSSLDALYMAADAMVARILGIPGFFASTLAFISDRTGHAEVYTSDILFNRVRQLTRDRNEAVSPNLHPRGEALLYTSYHGTGFPDIFRIDLRTGQRTTFAGFRGNNTGASFSPDGNSVAMVLSPDGNSEIFVSDANGRQLRRLTRTAALEADPSWSPDGNRIVFTSDQMGRPQIFTMNRDGSQYTRLRTDISRNCSEPDWNPRDANLIVFTAATAGTFQLAIFEFEARQSRFVTTGPGDAVHPVWLRDGRHIIFTERTSRHNRLMILDSITGHRARLAPADLNNSRQATWFYP